MAVGEAKVREGEAKVAEGRLSPPELSSSPRFMLVPRECGCSGPCLVTAASRLALTTSSASASRPSAESALLSAVRAAKRSVKRASYCRNANRRSLSRIDASTDGLLGGGCLASTDGLLLLDGAWLATSPSAAASAPAGAEAGAEAAEAAEAEAGSAGSSAVRRHHSRASASFKAPVKGTLHVPQICHG